MRRIKIDTTEIGPGNPCYIIAEAGVNHNGKMSLAKKLIGAAKKAGANAIKFQTYSTERLVTPHSEKAAYQRAGHSDRESQYQMLKRLELSDDDFQSLSDYAEKNNITFLSSPFDEESADFLETLDVPAYKVGSGELTNIPLLQHIAHKNRPMILSTGMATIGEVETALHAIQKTGLQDIVLLHCISGYPSAIGTQNLLAIQTLEHTFHVPVGFSDHTEGVMAAIIAVSLGAVVIEKHLTLDKKMDGPDHKASLEPDEFADLVHAVRITESALGDGIKRPSPIEEDVTKTARKSIVAVKKIPRGTTITGSMVCIKRPGTGIPPALLDSVIGMKARRAIKKDQVLSWEYIG